MTSQLSTLSLFGSALLELLRPANVICGLGAWFAWRVAYALYFSPLRNVPGPFWARVSSLPMVLHDLKGTEADFMIENYEKYGSLYVMGPEKVAVCDLDDCQIVLSSHSFAKDPRYAQVDILEPNLFLTRDPELSRQRRRQIGPTFSMTGLSKMEPMLLAAGPQQLMAKWDRAIDDAGGSARVCYHYDFSLMTFDIISSLGFGQSHRSLTTGDRRIVHWVGQTFTLMLLQMAVPIVKSLPFRHLFAKSLYADVRRFISFGSQAIEERRSVLASTVEASSGAEKPRDLLQAFIDAEDPESKIRMTSSQVTTETILTLMAGADTSSNTLSWTIHLLLLHPRCFARVLEEVRSKFKPDQLISFKEAKEGLPFMEACAYESMRLQPVSGSLPRCIPRGGAVLQKHFIPEGHTCSVSIAAANMNSTWWEKPYAFLPERFVGNEERKRRLLTFSMGVRVCPGKNLAWMEIITTLANIFNRYDIEMPKDSLFSPELLDSNGCPVLMPYRYSITRAPRYPERDCNIVIAKRQ
ncbi:hypothetical protein H4S02_007703 [Coemansia sp. RSA 2611]|nr:hypothetical protein H4S02_007703 [Coemansia sp. RSA 2611]